MVGVPLPLSLVHYQISEFSGFGFFLKVWAKMGGCVSLDLSCDQALNQTCNCLFGDRNYIHMMKTNLDALETAMQEFREKRDDIARKVSIEEDKGLEQLAQVKDGVQG